MLGIVLAKLQKNNNWHKYNQTCAFLLNERRPLISVAFVQNGQSLQLHTDIMRNTHYYRPICSLR